MTYKKNWTMRAAVLLLALVLITSCFVGGTFAKYVTSGSGSDTARVAKFGVTVSVSDNTMFKTQYKTKDDNVLDVENTVIEYSVNSKNGTDKLVAPGTSENDTLTFSVTGEPEVAVDVQLKLNVNSDVFLKNGTYRDYTTADANKSFTLTENYTPVVFTLKNGTNVVATGTLADINTKLNELSGNYTPNTNLTDKLGTYTLSWTWAFEDAATTNNAADTLLGNLAAGTVTDVDTNNYSTNIDFALTATVTQID